MGKLIFISVSVILLGVETLLAQKDTSYTFIINMEVADSLIEVETRVSVKYIRNNPNDRLIQMESPFYQQYNNQMRMGVMGSKAGPSLTWAPGAEHVYTNDTLAFNQDEHREFKTQLTIIKGQLTIIIKKGLINELNWLPGWQFDSDLSFPLTFKVLKGVGYVYMCGRGKVVSPSGEIRTLGYADKAEDWIDKLKSNDPLIREAAAQALGWLRYPMGVRALINGLNDPEPLVRRSAAESLGKIGALVAMPALKKASNDTHGWTAETAEWAIEMISSSSAKN
ncbi:MAG: HEAT repeat domain-containing protein [bacterium]